MNFLIIIYKYICANVNYKAVVFIVCLKNNINMPFGASIVA